jgi:hypothetical protein
MTVALARQKPTKLNKRALLASLDLPGNARWNDAQPRLKSRIVEARLSGDDAKNYIVMRVFHRMRPPVLIEEKSRGQ